MFNSTAIEVVIGLVFIYILYSLLVTIITELIAGVLNQKGRILKKGVKRMLDDEDQELFSDEFLKRPEIKYLCNKNRLPSYINASTFSKAMINVLQKANDAGEVFGEYMKKLEEEKDKSETKELIYNLMVEANGNLDNFKELLGNWFDETMDRVAGWYKRRIQLITFIIGIVIAFALNVDTIAIAKKLTRESDTRLELVKVATEYAAEDFAADSTTVQINAGMNEIVQQIQDQESIISLGWPPLDPRTGDFWLYVLGCLTTAIALSLGAPFWFDILNKLSKLRGGGEQVKMDTGKDDKK